ncbi:MAG: 16S rRNA (uracil(1498)-N(3))-methyltransferase [Syntrophothermus sp.]
MQLFYSTLVQNDHVILPEEESWHCTRVLRMNPGDAVSVTDGQGHLFLGSLTDVSPKRCLVKILETKTEQQRDWRLHIAIAPTKNIDRFEWFAEKATEIGIDSITPLYSKHSERTRLKPERIQKILVSAMKQSLKYTLPVLKPETSFSDFIRMNEGGSRFIAYCETGQEEELVFQYKNGTDVTIMIGPEGDFSPEEVDMALEAGFKAVRLGKSRLRTETAGIVACHTIHVLNTMQR